MLILTIVGLLITALQFSLLANISRRHRFASALLTLLGIHTIVALLSQAAGIFTYPVVLGFHAASILGMLYWVRLPRISTGAPVFSTVWIALKQTDLYLLLVLVISVSYLALPHFNYTGLISHATEPEKTLVDDYAYTYPYFSDEWYTIAIARQTITEQAFPQSNPLEVFAPPIRNIEGSFHALVAEITVFYRLDLLQHYVLLSIVINALIIAALYLLGRALGAISLAALVAAVSALFMTTGANLPGLWNLLPITLGVLPLTLSFIFLISNQRWWYLTASCMTVLFYPPLVALIIPVAIIQTIRSKAWLGTTIILFALTAATGAIVFAVSSIGSGLTSLQLLQETRDQLWYSSFTPDAFPHYPIWQIVPLVTLFAALLGLIQVRWSDRWLVISISIGLGYWLMYHSSNSRFLIEYQRIILVTALLLSAAASLGWHTLLSWIITAAGKWDVPKPSLGLSLVAIGIFASLWPGYTQRDNWQHLTLNDTIRDVQLSPSAPANDYLQPADLRAFSGLAGAHFLAPPWKGTVIGVATDNYPITTKGGTITLQPGLFTDFLLSDCSERQRLMRTHKVTHVYTSAFVCDDFSEISRGSESLVLYQFKNGNSGDLSTTP